MNVDQLVQQIVANPLILDEHTRQLEELPPGEGAALVPHLVQSFHAYQLWPQDAACLIAACHPTDDQLLEILKDDRERCQKLGLHILAQLMDTSQFQQQPHAALAQVVLSLLQTKAFRPKRKHLRSLEAWAKTSATSADDSPAQG